MQCNLFSYDTSLWIYWHSSWLFPQSQIPSTALHPGGMLTAASSCVSILRTTGEALIIPPVPWTVITECNSSASEWQLWDVTVKSLHLNIDTTLPKKILQIPGRVCVCNKVSKAELSLCCHLLSPVIQDHSIVHGTPIVVCLCSVSFCYILFDFDCIWQFSDVLCRNHILLWQKKKDLKTRGNIVCCHCLNKLLYV